MLPVVLTIAIAAGLTVLYWLTNAGWLVGRLIGLLIMGYLQWRRRKP
jgi:hypothetical protein